MYVCIWRMCTSLPSRQSGNQLCIEMHIVYAKANRRGYENG